MIEERQHIIYRNGQPVNDDVNQLMMTALYVCNGQPDNDDGLIFL